MKSKKEFNVGDEVVFHLKDTASNKIKIKGTIKEINQPYGHRTYLITKAMLIKDFKARVVEK